MYSERPSAVVPGAVVWTAVSDGSDARVLPDGCMDLLWDGSALSVAGPDTVAKVHRTRPGAAMTGLRFAPGSAPRVLGAPAAEFVDGRPSLDEVWSPAAVAPMIEAVGSAADPASALEAIAVARWQAGSGAALIDAALIDEVTRLVGDGHPIATVADRVGLSARQLHRRSLDAFGYGAKSLGRILRLQQTLGLVRAGMPPARAAALGGYTDQPHLARDVKALTGVPLGALLG